MSVLTEAAPAVVRGRGLAHLVTLDADGAPQVSAVWVGLEGDELVTGHLGANRKVADVEGDPRVALSIGTGEVDPVQRGGAPELLDRLARDHLDGGSLRITPLRVGRRTVALTARPIRGSDVPAHLLGRT